MARFAHRRGELISATGALLLGLDMFVLAWYGRDGIPGRTPRLVYAVNAWDALILVRWLMLLTILAAVGAVALHISQRGHGGRTETGALITVLGTLTSLALMVRVLVVLPSSNAVVDQKLGAFAGLVLALVIAYGGLETLREERRPAAADHRPRRSADPGETPPRHDPSAEPPPASPRDLSTA